MASTIYDAYRHPDTNNRQSTERVIWILVTVLLFLLAFSMGTRTDVERMTQMHNSSKALATSDTDAFRSGANGANYALMRMHR